MKDRDTHQTLMHEIREQSAVNPVFSSNWIKYIDILLSEYATSFDHAADFNEVCKLQGARDALKKLKRVVQKPQ